MVRNLNATCLARLYCAHDSFVKVFPTLISQQRHQVAGKPILYLRLFITLHNQVKLLLSSAEFYGNYSSRNIIYRIDFNAIG